MNGKKMCVVLSLLDISICLQPTTVREFYIGTLNLKLKAVCLRFHDLAKKKSNKIERYDE